MIIRLSEKALVHGCLHDICKAPSLSLRSYFQFQLCDTIINYTYLSIFQPYHVLIDTNFINFSVKNKLDVVQSMMDCLYAKCIPYVTDCVMAELEKLGTKYRVALKVRNMSQSPLSH